MVEISRRFLTLAAAAACLPPTAVAQKFFDDDPLLRTPPPRRVKAAAHRQVNAAYDYFANTFLRHSLVQQRGAGQRAGNVNTADEVPDGEWFVNRHARLRLSPEELTRGAGSGRPPVADGIWRVVAFNENGPTRGMEIKDEAGRHYLLKFDPPGDPELATAADVVGSRFFHAMGYNVPENYLVRFLPSQLQVAPGATVRHTVGRRRPMVAADIRTLLRRLDRMPDGRIRAMASLMLTGEPLGGFRFYGRRSDDPNDIVDHEHRRELRGLLVPAEWLNHTDINALNTLDTLIEEAGLRYIRHHLLDFNSILGSDGYMPKAPRSGHVNLLETRPALLQLVTLGAWIPAYARARYPDIRGVGRFEADTFDPGRWRPNYTVTAFEQARPDDTYWGAKLVLAFTEADIRAILATAEYRDPQAVEWIARVLMHRREKIGRYYLDRVLPLEDFALREDRLEFTDLAVKHGFLARRAYKVQWSRFDNRSARKTLLAGQGSQQLPAEMERLPAGEYAAADIFSESPNKAVTVYFLKTGSGFRLVGVERLW